ncbi:MAG: hypothetical protein PW843_29325 [Azospirillaceae bacterium]|nr:hypothetical protein [Azospirillaceae bacterium]
MGVLIVAGFTFIGVEIWRRATDPMHPRAFGHAATPPVAGGAPSPTAAAPLLTLPEGSHIEAMTTVGSRLAVQVTLSGGAQQIILLDPNTGKGQIAAATGTTSPDTPSSTSGAPALNHSEPNQTMRPQVPRTP